MSVVCALCFVSTLAYCGDELALPGNENSNSIKSLEIQNEDLYAIYIEKSGLGDEAVIEALKKHTDAFGKLDDAPPILFAILAGQRYRVFEELWSRAEVRDIYYSNKIDLVTRAVGLCDTPAVNIIRKIGDPRDLEILVGLQEHLDTCSRVR
ncbi:MAG: hypothetical protein IPM37_10180 [Hahellaceae bacterium]|nr:hypothetical protein [Hahellaceae bacterium]